MTAHCTCDKLGWIGQGHADECAVSVAADYDMEIEQLNRQVLSLGAELTKVREQLAYFSARTTAMHKEVLVDLADLEVAKAACRLVKFDHSLIVDHMTPTDWDICGGGPGEKSGHTPVDFEFDYDWVRYCWDVLDDDVRSDILGGFEEDYKERSRP